MYFLYFNFENTGIINFVDGERYFIDNHKNIITGDIQIPHVIRIEGVHYGGTVYLSISITAQFPSESNILLQDNSVLTKDKNGQ